MWAGPIFNWIAACELIEELDPAAIVPGHGPLTDLAGVRDVADYLRLVRDGVEARFVAGMGPLRRLKAVKPQLSRGNINFR